MREEVRQKVVERFPISEQVMRLLLESTKITSFVPKDIIVHEGRVNANMYILFKGIRQAYTFKDGMEDTSQFAMKSEIVLSVWGYTSGSPSLYTIEAITESKAYCLSKRELEILLQSSVQLASIGRRILENLMLEIETSWLSSHKRTAIERYTTLLDKQPEIIRPVPLKYVTSYPGIMVQSLSRIRAELTSSLTFTV